MENIETAFPDRIELNYSAIKGVKFFADNKGEGKSIGFDELGINDSTRVIISQRKTGIIQTTVSNSDVNDSANFIPCCTIVRFYENIPVLVPSTICFIDTRPTVDDNTSTYRTVKKKTVETMKNGRLLKMVCFDGAILLNIGRVRCERCPGTSLSCRATYILNGVEYPANINGVPDDRYYVRSEQGNRPCGNCPEDACDPKIIK